MTATETPTKTFYSMKTGLCISPRGMKGTIQEIDGVSTRVGEVLIQFVPMGQDKFGYYTTSDLREIEYLEKRISEVGDVFGPAEFNRRSTPDSIRAEMAERIVEDQNRLIAKLTQDNEQLKQSPKGPIQPPVTK